MMDERSEIKMIALDLDRTTLCDTSSISRPVFDALEEAGKRGVSVVIATGRVFDALPDPVFALSSVKYFICSNGAAVFDAGSRKILFEQCLDPEAVRMMVEYVRERGYMFESFTDGFAYIGRDYYEKIRDGKLMYRSRGYVMGTRNPVDDIFAFTLAHKDRIENLNVFFPTQEEKAAFRPLMASIPHSVMTSSVPSNYELGGEGVSKGAALKRILKMNNVDTSELMACGDSPNDLSMLELAGVPVAVGNAEESVKQAAVYIAPPCTEDGVADAVNKLVLQQ